MSRLPLRHDAQIRMGQIQDVQKVRFGKPPLRTRVRRAFLTSLGLFITLELALTIVDLRLSKLDLDGLPNEEEEEEESLFIPFPGTEKRLPPHAYTGDDPEWKSYVKFAKDKEAGQRARGELAAICLKTASSHPVLVAKFGKEMKIKRTWLDIDFPPFAPPEYERSGLELPIDGPPRLGIRRVDDRTMSQVSAILFPSPLIQGGWAFFKVATVDGIGKLAGALGLRSSPQPPSLQHILMQNAQIAAAKAPQMASKNGGSPPPTENGGNAKSVLTSKEEQNLSVPAPTKIIKDSQTFLLRPVGAFWAKYHKAQADRTNSSELRAPKGSIIVNGLVEIDAPRGWIVFDVVAAYQPQEKQFDVRAFKIQVRRMVDKKQRPAIKPPRIGPPPVAGRPY